MAEDPIEVASKDLGSSPATDTISAVNQRQQEFLSLPGTRKALRDQGSDAYYAATSQLDGFRQERLRRTPDLFEALRREYEVETSVPKLETTDPVINDWLKALLPDLVKGVKNVNTPKINQDFRLSMAFSKAFSEILSSSTIVHLRRVHNLSAESTLVQEGVDPGWLVDPGANDRGLNAPAVEELFTVVQMAENWLPAADAVINAAWTVKYGQGISGDSSPTGVAYQQFKTDLAATTEGLLRRLSTDLDFGQPPSSKENYALINGYYRAMREASADAHTFLNGNRPQKYKS
jgi:hypothetical protein